VDYSTEDPSAKNAETQKKRGPNVILWNHSMMLGDIVRAHGDEGSETGENHSNQGSQACLPIFPQKVRRECADQVSRAGLSNP
jgi:hypothetical protein